MNIRKAQLEDVPTYLEIRESAIRSLANLAYSGEQIESWVDSADPEKVRRFIQSGSFYIGETDDKIAICTGGWFGNQVVSFYISPTFARQGYASALLSFVEKDYREATGREIINVEASNNASAFYEANGYEFVSLEEGTDEPIPYTYSVMKKKL